MTYPRRAPRHVLLARITAVQDVSVTMRQIDLVGPDVPRLRCRPGAHVVVRLPTGTGEARRVYSIWRHDPARSALSLRLALHDAGGPGGFVALSVGKIEADLSSEVIDPPASVAVAEVGVRWVPVPAGGDRGRGALVSAVQFVLSRR